MSFARVNGYLQDFDESSTTCNYVLGTLFMDDQNQFIYRYCFFSIAISQGFAVEAYSAVPPTVGGATPVFSVKKLVAGSQVVGDGVTMTDMAAQTYGFICVDGVCSTMISGAITAGQPLGCCAGNTDGVLTVPASGTAGFPQAKARIANSADTACVRTRVKFM